jgi:ketol-acid reductoisomerase
VEAPIREAVRPVFEAIVKDVTAGDFARRWVADYENGRARLHQMRGEAGEHPLETAGETMRGAARRRAE